MSDAPEIKVKLTAEDAGVAAAIKELGAQLKNLKKQEDETAASGLSLAKAFEGIASAGALLGLAKIGKDAFDSAVGISKMADKTGLTTQTLSVFHKVAGDVGVATEAVDKGLVKAAKSITEFQQGNQKAAQAFALLNIAQKDFIGLSPDQKIQLVTSRLGGMAAGFQKSTAAQLIFSKGGSELIPVMNALAAQGFDKASEATSKLGLLLDRNTTDSFIAARASIQELSDTGKGMATQFEAGMLPAISDVGEALADSLQQGGVNFQDLGKYAGDVVRGIALAFLALGQTLGTVAASVETLFEDAFDAIKNHTAKTFIALGQAGTGDLIGAYQTLNAATKGQTGIVDEEVAKQKAIYKTLADSIKADVANINPSAEEEERRKKARIANQRLDEGDTTPEKPIVSEPRDAAAKAQVSLEEKILQDQLAIHRAFAKQEEAIDKERYDDGLISLKEYYDKRKAQAAEDSEQEIAILQKERAVALAASNKAGADAGKQIPGSPQQDKLLAEQIAGKEKVADLDARISEAQINASTKIHALNTEENKAQRESQRQTLDFEKQLAEMQGKRSETARVEIEAETQKRQKQIEQAGGNDAQKAQLLGELEQWKQLKLAVAEYDQARQKLEQDTKAFETAKQTIQNTAASGKISKLEEEKQINQLIKDRLPLLQADAAAETGAAAKTGNLDNQAQAAQDQANVNKLTLSVKDLGTTLGQSVAGDFASFFQTVGRGTQTVAESFQKLAGSVIQSIEQMLIKLLLFQIAQKAAGAFSAGSFGNSFFSGFGGGHAEGGLIKGQGGPKSDSIPARLSPGEFVVKADAVSTFGAHNLEAINRGLKPPTFANLELPKFAEGGLVGTAGAPGASGTAHVAISLDKGLILQHLSSKDAGRIVLDHISSNPKAASKALGRSQG
jgi:hypothetical protein